MTAGARLFACIWRTALYGGRCAWVLGWTVIALLACAAGAVLGTYAPVERAPAQDARGVNALSITSVGKGENR